MAKQLLTDSEKAIAFNYLCGAFSIIGDTKILDKTINQVIEDSMAYALKENSKNYRDFLHTQAENGDI